MHPGLVKALRVLLATAFAYVLVMRVLIPDLGWWVGGLAALGVAVAIQLATVWGRRLRRHCSV